MYVLCREYAAATLPFLSCEKILLPNRLASAARTECGISVSKTRMLDPIAERKEEIMSFALFVRLSTMVSKMPSILFGQIQITGVKQQIQKQNGLVGIVIEHVICYTKHMADHLFDIKVLD